MLSRRQILIGSALGGMAAGLGSRGAAAFSIETAPRFATDAFALACKPLGGSDHRQVAAAAQATLKNEIARGALAADAQEVVVCPICGCRFIVTAYSSD